MYEHKRIRSVAFCVLMNRSIRIVNIERLTIHRDQLAFIISLNNPAFRRVLALEIII